MKTLEDKYSSLENAIRCVSYNISQVSENREVVAQMYVAGHWIEIDPRVCLMLLEEDNLHMYRVWTRAKDKKQGD